ncbi:MAG: SDR family oxidoreductase [Tannerellaceae bacterium]|nr:SDR family oxidoreductase [Tannerellaceae bacterium]
MAMDIKNRQSVNMKGRRVFVTGGAKGIGKAIVETFVAAGDRVAFCDIDREAGEQLCDRLGEQVRFHQVDVSDEKQLTSLLNLLFKEWGDLDILINNVGISLFSPLTRTSVRQFDQILSTNLRPVFITSRAWAIHRDHAEGKSRYGRIVNISSTRYLQSEPGSEGYAASKGGIVSLTHALAVSLSAYRITVNCISPGWIQTTGYDALSTTDHAQHPSGRVGRPEDIAAACLFLCKAGNDFINGQNITIDGGMTKKMIYEE